MANHEQINTPTFPYCENFLQSSIFLPGLWECRLFLKAENGLWVPVGKHAASQLKMSCWERSC